MNSSGCLSLSCVSDGVLSPPRRHLGVGKMEPGAKMHMKEWLIAQIESGKYAGLCWEDEDKTMFRIPWKHAAKKDYRQTADAALFKVCFTIRHSHSCVPQL